MVRRGGWPALAPETEATGGTSTAHRRRCSGWWRLANGRSWRPRSCRMALRSCAFRGVGGPALHCSAPRIAAHPAGVGEPVALAGGTVGLAPPGRTLVGLTPRRPRILARLLRPARHTAAQRLAGLTCRSRWPLGQGFTSGPLMVLAVRISGRQPAAGLACRGGQPSTGAPQPAAGAGNGGRFQLQGATA